MQKKYAYYLILSLLTSTSWVGCQSNQQKMAQVQDSLMALNSSDSSILIYADGLEKLKEALVKKESPVYNKGDYSFYTSIYSQDSVPVLFVEYGEAGDNGFVEKKYYLDNEELVLYWEKSKHVSSGEKPIYEFKETRIYFRNNVFLKGEERVAAGDSLLSQIPFALVDDYLLDKNKQFDFKRLEDASAEVGDFNLTFDRIDSLSASRQYLVKANNKANTYESTYQIIKADSLISKIKENPYAYKGKRLKVQHSKQGIRMIYKGAELSTF